MTTKIQKWGNSSAIRIPKSLMQASGLVQGGEVAIEFRDGLLTVKPKKQKEYTLKELLKGMTKENRHELVDWGPDVGNEILEAW